MESMFDLRDLFTDSWNGLLHVQGSDWVRSAPQVDASTSSNDACAMQELSNLSWDATFSGASAYSTSVDQVNLGVALGMEDCDPALFGPCSSFGMSDVESLFSSTTPAQDSSRCIVSSPENISSLVLTDDPRMDHVPQTSTQVSGCPISSILAPPPTLYTINLNPQTSCLGQDTDMSFKTTSSYALSSMEIPPRHGGGSQPTARSWAESISSNLADPAAWIDSSLHLGENCQGVDFEAAQGLSCVANLPFEWQHTPFEGPVGICKWKKNGTICGCKITRASLPEHLSIHGIKNMSRNTATKCNWVGCKKRGSINRESIARHIREVHLHWKRPTKRVQEPHL